MTTISNEVKKCAYCGKKAKVSELRSTIGFGTCDLDLRPPELHRNTIRVLLQNCPHCGYVSYNLGRPIKYLDKFKEVFPTLEKADNLMERYRLGGDIMRLVDENHDAAFYMYLNAAWCADDENDAASAKRMRLKALEQAKEYMAEDELKIDFYVQYSDVARRAGEFDFASTMIEKALTKNPSEYLMEIIEYEKSLIEAKDVACHCISDAVK